MALAKRTASVLGISYAFTSSSLCLAVVVANPTPNINLGCFRGFCGDCLCREGANIRDSFRRN